MVDANEPIPEELNNSHDGMNIPLSDAPLLDLLDALVSDLGKVAAAEALGVNYRTMVACYDSRRVSPRMRRALEQYRDAADGDGDDLASDDAGVISEKVVALEERVAALEEERRELREVIEAQAQQLTELGRKVEGLEDEEQQPCKADAVGDADGRRREWRPPRRDHRLPDAGVVTLEEQPDEEYAFGPAAELVAEWRAVRTRAEALGGRVERAGASVRRWELEIAMLRDFHLTLPPETAPLDSSRREDHLRWRREALATARQELSKAQWLRWLRRTLTVGLWRK